MPFIVAIISSFNLRLGGLFFFTEYTEYGGQAYASQLSQDCGKLK